MEVDSWEIWKEEYDEICRLELEKGEATKELARRFLIWTEGFVLKVLNTNMMELSEKNLKILKELSEKNKLMLENKK